MKLILFTLMTIILTACGGSNTTGPAHHSNQIQETESITQESHIKAKLLITSFVGSNMRTENVELKVSDFDQVALIRDGKSETSDMSTSSIAFYIDNIEKRMKLSEELTATNISHAEVIIDANDVEKFRGKWGWLENDGAVTTYEDLPLFGGQRMILKIADKNLIADLLTQKKILSMWFDKESVLVNKVDNIASVQNLKLRETFEYEVTPRITNAGFVRLNAFKRSYSVQNYDQAIQYIEYLEPTGRGTLPRRVTQTCYLKMQKVVVSNEEALDLYDVIEFDGHAEVVDGWWYSQGEGHLRLKTNLTPKLVNTGLVSWGSCHPSNEFTSQVPGTSQINAATRVVVKADVYFAP